MTAVDTTPIDATPTTADGTIGRAVTGLAVRQVRRGALVVMALVGGMSAVVVAMYRSTAGDSLAPAALQALAENVAIRTLFGEPVALDDAGGFAVWRTGTVLAVLLGVWALLAATGITRGEEDAGRWDLLLAGRQPLATVVARHLAVIVAATACAGTAISVSLIAAGATPAGAVLHGAGLALVGAFFTAAGGLAAQLFPTRAGASGAAVALLGVGLLIRMAGDGIEALEWLRWLSPFGLVALTRPYAESSAVPLLVLAVAAGLLFASALFVAARRDLRGGWLAGAGGRAPRLRLLGSVHGFAVRRTLRPLAGWCAGVGAYYLLIGLVMVSMTGFLTDNPRFADLAAQAGFAAIGSVSGAVATLFALLAIPAGVLVAVRLAALAAAETNRQLTLLYAGPVTRIRLLAAETAAALGAAVVLTTVAATATWLGTTSVGAELTLGAALAGTLNVLPIVMLCLGAAVLALGWEPRAVAAIGALPAVGGFLLQVIADTAGAPAWVGTLSPFAHLAAVPHAPVDWAGSGVMVAIAALLAAIGTAGYRRRDLCG